MNQTYRENRPQDGLPVGVKERRSVSSRLKTSLKGWIWRTKILNHRTVFLWMWKVKRLEDMFQWTVEVTIFTYLRLNWMSDNGGSEWRRSMENKRRWASERTCVDDVEQKTVLYFWMAVRDRTKTHVEEVKEGGNVEDSAQREKGSSASLRVQRGVNRPLCQSIKWRILSRFVQRGLGKRELCVMKSW